MRVQQTAPYGSWASPIVTEWVSAAALRLGQIALDEDDTYWLEGRPAQGGRSVIVRRNRAGALEDVTPARFNVRTRVHEYGGGAYLVDRRTIYFTDFQDQRLYVHQRGTLPLPITPDTASRYCDAILDHRHRRLICVREDHTTSDREAVNSLVGVHLDGSDAGRVLAAGHDFFSSPRLSPDGGRLSWLTWDHPNMPWDGTDLWMADVLADGSLGSVVHVAGGAAESIVQPEWSPAGELHFISDRSGWWNLYRWRSGRGEPLAPMEAEFGYPQWVFGLSSYAFESDARIICAYTREGRWHLATLETSSGHVCRLEVPYTEIDSLRARPGYALFCAGSPTEPSSIVQLNLENGERYILRRSSSVPVDPGYVSTADPIEFPTTHGRTAHALFYRPRNRDYVGPAGQAPPLIVMSHGGPTSRAANQLSWSIQFWTSRGFAVVDVDYGGSTGYGRPYRERLNGQWGVADVDDCVGAALYLAQKGWVDGRRLAIRGGSAGGYTTLCSVTFRDVFHAAASYYGISDLEALARDTHKFESRYVERLVGPYPERRDLYLERSPIHFADRVVCPIIFFQGLEDKVVPPDQSETLVAALRQRGVPVAYMAFEGEQHGFRRAENIRRSLEAELYFYGRVFGFQPADEIEAVAIQGL